MATVYTAHALERIDWRGTSLEEVDEVLENGSADAARPGYEARYKVFPYGKEWGRKFYPQKRVRVVFAEEGQDTVVVTVYVYFGSWDE